MEFMPEDKTGRMNSIVEEILGLHPDPDVLVEHTSNTIFKLASMGMRSSSAAAATSSPRGGLLCCMSG